MLDIIIYLLALIITAPIAVTWIVYLIGFKLYRHKWKALHKSVNWTTPLYIIAVLVLFNLIFEQSFFGVLLVVLPSLFTIIAVVQWRLYTEVAFRNIFKIFWRICFLLFGILYCLLILIGIVKQILS
ncbi:DUF3397 domain-containing protein [Virgibacillus siamensis]|uniref:DUF3397 domain-containing protein n=1 Tax=Virgibacillus siamensis TaxID=480071 RepID=UPI0009870038|nr:DUF3397 domain-containing protein [Virgibacillus siamensis]